MAVISWSVLALPISKPIGQLDAFGVAIDHSMLLAKLNSMVLDYSARNTVASTHLSEYLAKQLPVLSPESYEKHDYEFVIPRVSELTYTAWDLQPFAEDMGYAGPPFHWDEERRALLRAELDALYAHLYGLNRKQLRYILDPADLTAAELEDILDPWEEVTDPLDPDGYAARAEASDFPGETFRVLKNKDNKQYGEYRTRNLVLAAWERLSAVNFDLDAYRPHDRSAACRSVRGTSAAVWESV